ncbi:iron-binding protein [Dionaea muscipula]
MLRQSCKKLLGFAQSQTQLQSQPIPLVLTRLYHERVVDHYNNPRNVGSFDKNDPDVGTGLVGAPACGDVMKLQIKVDEKTGKIVDACFKTFGCGSAIASSSLATEWVKGKEMEEALTIKNSEIAKHLSLPPVKLHCSMLAEDAIKAAIKDYEKKRAKGNDEPETTSAVKVAAANA